MVCVPFYFKLTSAFAHCQIIDLESAATGIKASGVLTPQGIGAAMIGPATLANTPDARIR
jgi:hypothetical protein